MIRTAIFIASLCLFGQNAYSQSEPLEHNASVEDITGDWQLLPMPEALQSKALNTNPWPAQCQWFSYANDGTLKSIDKTNSSCETLSAARLDEIMQQVPAVTSWKYDLSPQFQKALIIVGRSDVKGYAEYWEPHVVTSDFSRAGEEFKQGDLILYLVNIQTHQVLWIRHLRKLS